MCFCIPAIHPFYLVNLIFLLASSLFCGHKKWHTQWSRQFGLRWIKFFRSRFTDTAVRNELSVTTRIAFTEVAPPTPVTLHILKVLRPGTLLPAFIHTYIYFFCFRFSAWITYEKRKETTGRDRNSYYVGCGARGGIFGYSTDFNYKGEFETAIRFKVIDQVITLATATPWERQNSHPKRC